METTPESEMPENKSGRVRSGKARMEKLSPEERSILARQAAEARWERVVPVGDIESLPKATHPGKLAIGDIIIPCAVLDNKTRVITQRGAFVALGMNKNPTKGQSAIDNRPGFLAANNLTPFIPGELSRSWNPIPFRLARGSGGYRGNIAFGYDARILPKVCYVFLDAHSAGRTTKRQQHIVDACKILVRGFAEVGIIALVDEATGYQREREEHALEEALNLYIGNELAKWAKRFPDEFYKQMCRLKRIQYDPYSSRRPHALARITVDVVYDRLGPGLTEELKRRKSDRISKGGRDHKLHQWLTEEIGHPSLAHHLSGVTFLAQNFADGDWSGFKESLDRISPPYNRTMFLDLYNDEPGPISSTSIAFLPPSSQ